MGWHGAEGGLKGRGGTQTCQGCIHEQVQQLDEVGGPARESTVAWQDTRSMEGHRIKFHCLLH